MTDNNDNENPGTETEIVRNRENLYGTFPSKILVGGIAQAVHRYTELVDQQKKLMDKEAPNETHLNSLVCSILKVSCDHIAMKMILTLRDEEEKLLDLAEYVLQDNLKAVDLVEFYKTFLQGMVTNTEDAFAEVQKKDDALDFWLEGDKE